MVPQRLGRVVDRDKTTLELLLSYQAGEVERRLAQPPPASPRIFLAGDDDRAGPIRLGSGDVVVVTTDGIAEAHNPSSELFGRERLCQVLSAHAAGTAQDIHDAVMAAVGQFRASCPQHDDITLVVIKAE